MSITYKGKWGDPIVELLKLLAEDMRRIRSHRKHCERIHPRSDYVRKERSVKIQRTREETLRDVIHQIHIIRNAKRNRRGDGRPNFKPTDDEKRLIQAQFFAMAAMHESGQGQEGNGRFNFVLMDRPYLEKMVEITQEEYALKGGDGSALAKWGPLGFPRD